jgi:WD40 repeat protein
MPSYVDKSFYDRILAWLDKHAPADEEYQARLGILRAFREKGRVDDEVCELSYRQYLEYLNLSPGARRDPPTALTVRKYASEMSTRILQAACFALDPLGGSIVVAWGDKSSTEPVMRLQYASFRQEFVDHVKLFSPPPASPTRWLLVIYRELGRRNRQRKVDDTDPVDAGGSSAGTEGMAEKPDTPSVGGDRGQDLSEEGLTQSLLDFSLLDQQLRSGNPYILLAAFARAPRSGAVEAVRRAIECSAHILEKDPGQLAAQLLARLSGLPNPDIAVLLRQAMQFQKRCWLRPETASLSGPRDPLLRTLVGHQGMVLAVAISATGNCVVSVGAHGKVKVWDLVTYSEPKELSCTAATVTAMAITLDGTVALLGTKEGTILMMDLNDGDLIASLPGHKYCVTAIRIGASEDFAVSASEDGVLKVWDLEKRACACTMQQQAEFVTDFAFMRDGERVVSASRNGTIQIWKLRTGMEISRLQNVCNRASLRTCSPQEKRGFCIDALDHGRIAMTPDDRFTVLTFADRSVALLDLDPCEKITELGRHKRGVSSVAVSGNGDYAVSGSEDTTVKVWDLRRRAEVATLRGHGDDVIAVAVDGRGRLAVSACKDATLKVWDLSLATNGQSAYAHRGSVIAIAVRPDGIESVSACTEKQVHVWSTGSRQRVRSFESQEVVNAMAFGPTNEQLIVGLADGTLQLWDAATGQSVLAFSEHVRFVTSLAALPDGRGFVSTSYDNILRLWDYNRPTEPLGIDGRFRSVTSLAVSTDGTRMVSGTSDQHVCVWQLTPNIELLHRSAHASIVTAVAITPNGRLIVAGCRNGALSVWDIEKGICNWHIGGQVGNIRAMCVTPDAAHVVIGGQDGWIEVVRLANGESVTKFCGDSAITTCACVPGGQLIVAGEHSGSLHMLSLMNCEFGPE